MLNRKENTNILPSYLIIAMILLLIAVNLIYSSYFIKDAYPGHNMISNLIMASAPLQNIGLPYKDYWDIYPPGIYIFLTPFEYLFGGKTVVFKVFHLLFAISMGIMVLKFFKKIFQTSPLPAVHIIFFFLIYLILSNYYYSILFHNAFLALFVSTAGLYHLSCSKKIWSKYFLSAALFAFSASMKDTFMFTIFLPFLYVVSKYLVRENKSYKLFLKSIAWITAGILLILVCNYLYLDVLGVLNSYGEISAYKSQVMGGGSAVDLFNKLNPFDLHEFGFRFGKMLDSFFLHSYGLLYPLFVLLLLIFLAPIKFRKENGKYKTSWAGWNEQRSTGIIVFGFFLLNFEGFQLLNKYQPNYSLQMVPSLILAMAFLFRISLNSLKSSYLDKFKQINPGIKKVLGFAMVVFFIWILFPRPCNFHFMQKISLSGYMEGLSLKKPEILIPDKVRQTMGTDNRIFHLYGWGTPYFHYFAKVQPFSRFFILHPNILGEAQIRELVEQLKKGLPKVILYTDKYPDMNVEEFENSNFQFKKLLDKCYEFYPADIYEGIHCEGYYLLRAEDYFKSHPEEFISEKFR